MDGWIAALIAIVILGVIGFVIGFLALYQKHREIKKQH
jgi:uncharacterized membrane-anchored protein YhcB (DUF1043 family)